MSSPSSLLFACRQHWYMLVTKTARWVPVAALVWLVVWAASSYSAAAAWTGGLTAMALCGFVEYFLWNNSRLIITSEGMHSRVRNGVFSRFETHIRFDHIRDCAYSKNNILHFITGAGTLFARSSAGAEGDFQARHIPHVEKVFALVSDFMKTSPAERAAGKTAPAHPDRTREEAVRENLAVLRSIPGITGAAEISDDDRRFIFENEEDRNHGVYETLRRKAVLCLVHDEKFRQADAPIVLALGKKTVFPPVSFHEIREKNVVSSSPCLKVHERLVRHFPGAGPYDATVLVGFDF